MDGVLLVQDPFTALFDVDALNAVMQGFRALGFEPTLLGMRPGGKAAHVAGSYSGDYVTPWEAPDERPCRFPGRRAIPRRRWADSVFDLPPIP